MLPGFIKKPENAEYDLPLQPNYREVNFSGLDLSGYEFTGLDFSYANFRNCKIEGCKFNECVLYYTNFKGAIMNEDTKIRYMGMRNPLEAKAQFEDSQKKLLGLENVCFKEKV